MVHFFSLASVKVPQRLVRQAHDPRGCAPLPPRVQRGGRGPALPLLPRPHGLLGRAWGVGSRDAQLSRDPTNFRGLVLGCIEAKFCK